MIDLDNLFSSPKRGAKQDKPSAMMAFSLSVNELEQLHLLFFDRNYNLYITKKLKVLFI